MNEENKKFEETLKRYIDIVLEDAKKNFNILADGQKDLERKVDGLAEDLHVVKKDVEFLKEDMDFVKSEIVEIKDRFRENDKVLETKAEKEVQEDHENRLKKLETAVLAKA